MRRFVPAFAAPLICAVPPLLTLVVPVAPVGTPALQFPGVNQLPVPSVQLVVCALADEAPKPMATNHATSVHLSKLAWMRMNTELNGWLKIPEIDPATGSLLTPGTP